jgi:uncharacterized protein YutE (UPF0331/DUF86 family)
MLLDRLPKDCLAAIEKNKDEYPATYKSLMETLKKESVLSLTLEEVLSLRSMSDMYDLENIYDFIKLFNTEL